MGLKWFEIDNVVVVIVMKRSQLCSIKLVHKTGSGFTEVLCDPVVLLFCKLLKRAVPKRENKKDNYMFGVDEEINQLIGTHPCGLI